MGRRSVGGYGFRNDGKDSDAPYPAKATADAVGSMCGRSVQCRSCIGFYRRNYAGGHESASRSNIILPL